MHFANEGAVVVKNETDWSTYRSSFDVTNQNYTHGQNGMAANSAAVQQYQQQAYSNGMPLTQHANAPAPPPKRKGRPKKVKEEPALLGGVSVKQEQITDTVKVKKKRDRFKGTTEEEVLQRVLPDHVKPGLDILIIGINPGLTAAYVGHHYAGPGNHFWKCLFLSGLIPHQMNAYDDDKLHEYGIGFTNIVARTSRGSADLTKKEIKEGGEILMEKVQKYKPKIAVFNGKGIYEVFVGHKNFHIGKQPEPFPGAEGTAVFVMPSSSARFTQLPRAIDKVPFYLALKKYRDHISGRLPELKEEEVYFPDLNLKVVPKAERLAEIARQEAESGQLFIKPEHKPDLQQGESKPKRGRKKKTNDSTVQQFNLVNEVPNNVVVKPEPGVSQACTNQCAPAVEASSPPRGANVEEILANGGTLVKQEDVSELAKFGINTQHLQSTANMMAASSASGQMFTGAPVNSAVMEQYHQAAQASTSSFGGHFHPASLPPTTSVEGMTAAYWGGVVTDPRASMSQPFTTAAGDFVRPGFAYSQAVEQNRLSVNTGQHTSSTTTGVTGMLYQHNNQPSQPVTSNHCVQPPAVQKHHFNSTNSGIPTPGQYQQPNEISQVSVGVSSGSRCEPGDAFNQFNVRPSSSSTGNTSPHQDERSCTSRPSTVSQMPTPSHNSQLKQEPLGSSTHPAASVHPYWSQYSQQ